MSLFDPEHRGSALALTDLLSIEDTPELLAPRCPQTAIPVWPNIRAAFLRQIMAELLFSGGSIEPPAQRPSWRAATMLGRAVVHNAAAMLGKRLWSDVIINTEAVGDELRDGLWYNRYVDPFGDLPSGQGVVMTDMFEWQLRTPRHNERVFHHAPIQTGAVFAGSFPRGAVPRQLAESVVAMACDRADALLGWRMADDRRAAFVNWTTRKIAGLPYRYRAYRRLLRQVRPRLLLGSSGCYGIHAPLIAAARDLNIVTAEYQHGAISAGHDAYNFAPAIFASGAYRRTLPQYLLTYGSWWSAQVTAPVECVAIGYPARAAKLERMEPMSADRRDVLILGDGIEFDLYLELAHAVAQAIGSSGLRVVLRPHPLERSSVAQRYGKQIDGIRIDATPDIYSSFASAHTVVSEMSTGLFEAVGLVDRIVLLNTAKARFAFPVHPFAVAASVQEVVDLVEGDGSSDPAVEADDLWATDWKSRYRGFLVNKADIDV